MAESGYEVGSGREVELDVLRIAHGGISVADLRGQVVFVADTLPGERVLARITDESHPRFLRAETVRVLEASPDRRPHVWDEAAVDRDPGDRAGGAEFGHIAPARQRALKTTVLADALERTGGMTRAAIAELDPSVRAVPGTPDGTRSRTRVRLHADGTGRTGPFAARSHHVVPVRDLPLAVDAIRALLPRRADAGPIDLVAAADGAFVAAPGHRSPSIVERVGDRAFALEATGFWQVHPAAPEVLTSAVRAALDDVDPSAENLDLYGGAGLLAAALTEAGGPRTRVTTVEADRRASVHARRNLADLPGVRAVAARVDRFLREDPRPLPGATVVLDPPRAGAGAAVVDAIAAAAPARVVYVACDPVALARDIRTFAAHGYRPVRLEAFDLFPNTHHIEAVAALSRN